MKNYDYLGWCEDFAASQDNCSFLTVAWPHPSQAVFLPSLIYHDYEDFHYYGDYGEHDVIMTIMMILVIMINRMNMFMLNSEYDDFKFFDLKLIVRRNGRVKIKSSEKCWQKVWM